MTRLVIEDAGHFDTVRPQRCGSAQDVVALIRIEVANLIAENRLVVGDELEAAGAVVDDVELAAEVHVPHEHQILAGDVLGGESELCTR